ncbi:aminoacyl-tRNA hydrolase [soil metagenome]
MGLFERKSTPITSSYFSIGSEKTKLIVGLGNIGKKYQLTRHNAGFLCLDHAVKLAEGEWNEKKSLKSLVSEVRIGEKRVIFIKPTTLMNLSGNAVQAAKQFYKIEDKDIIVVHDELALPFGSLRIRIGGSDAGNNGIKSVSATIGKDYARLRIGIAGEYSEKEDAAAYVLKNFSKEEQGNFKALYAETNALITEFIFSDTMQPDTRQFI